jgi:hypothetical protein
MQKHPSIHPPYLHSTSIPNIHKKSTSNPLFFKTKYGKQIIKHIYFRPPFLLRTFFADLVRVAPEVSPSEVNSSPSS